jgi:hypothetical protein
MFTQNNVNLTLNVNVNINVKEESKPKKATTGEQVGYFFKWLLTILKIAILLLPLIG